MKVKKAISPVVATALLLVVAVTAVVGFQNWFQNFESNILASTEQKSLTSNIKIEGIVGDTLYLKSSGADTISLLKISDSEGNEMCTINSNTQLKGETRLLMTFDNNTVDGNIVKDLSGYGNNGTINGSTYTENNCVNGGCFNFNGIENSIDIENNPTLNTTNQFSIFANIKTLSDSRQRILVNRNTQSPDDDCTTPHLCINYIFNINDYNLSLVTGNSTNVYTIEQSLGNISNRFVQVGAIYDGNSYSLYLNGNLIKKETSIIQPSFDNDIEDKIYIGKDTYGGSTLYRFNGTIDEVAIYSKALTDEEVKALYNAKKALPYELILGDGIKSIDISSCNLQKGQQYNIVTFTQNSKAESTIIKK